MSVTAPSDDPYLDPLWSIVTNAPTPIFFKDPEGSYLFVNAAAAAATGKEREQIIGRNESDLFPESEASEIRAKDLEVMRTRKRDESVITLTLGGRSRTLMAMKFPLFDIKGEVLGVCGITVDITDTLVVEEEEKSERKREIQDKPFARLLATLTQQEARIAELLMLGHSDKQISEALNLTTGTVRHHVSHLLKKLRKRSRTQAVIAILKLRGRD